MNYHVKSIKLKQQISHKRDPIGDTVLTPDGYANSMYKGDKNHDIQN